jgi:flagellar biosynthetic protein FliR
MVKAGWALILTIFWCGSWDALLSNSLLAQPMPVVWVTYALALGREAILGAVLGYALGLLLVPARIAGEYLGQEMGLTLGSLSDPGADHSATVMGQIFEMFGTLIFLGLDGHHVFLMALRGTFAHWPIGGALAGLPVNDLVSGAAAAQEWGLVLAAPLAVCLFLTAVVLSLMARAVPQLNILTIGFPLRIGVGLVAAILLLPNLGAALVSIFGRLSAFVYRLA